jgi:hypothetical protein
MCIPLVLALLMASASPALAQEDEQAKVTFALKSASEQIDLLLRDIDAGAPGGTIMSDIRNLLAYLYAAGDVLEDLDPDSWAQAQRLGDAIYAEASGGSIEEVRPLALELKGKLLTLMEMVSQWGTDAGSIITVKNYSIKPGDTFTIPIVLKGAPPDLASYEVGLSFDPSILQATRVAIVLGQGRGEINNDRGIVAISASVPEAGAVDREEQTIAEVEFEAVGKADESTGLMVVSPILFDSAGRALPAAAFDGSVKLLPTEKPSPPAEEEGFPWSIVLIAILVVVVLALLSLRFILRRGAASKG